MRKRYFGSESGLKTLEEGRQVVHGLLPDYVFGPVDSRRYGKSLGVNPFPLGEKICSFNCPYCECGWTNRLWVGSHNELEWPTVEALCAEIEARLVEMKERGESLDAITFAGNGEPTLHPEFPALIRETRALRDRLAPETRLIVLTNATELYRPEIREALLQVDEPCMKLDAVSAEVVDRINKPHDSVSMEKIIDWIADFPSPIIQAMFVRGPADNTGPREVSLWIEALKKIRPRRVDLYSLDRPAPDRRLERVPNPDLESIAKQVRAALDVPVFVY
jgi:wyosine [tRNA(Phe)-imidazoG37] synthetase (radical SAM superfamily)